MATDTVSLESNEFEAEVASELRRLLKLRPVSVVIGYMTEHEGEMTVDFLRAGLLDSVSAPGLAHLLLQHLTWGGD